jgi:hypothetical protein
MRPDDITGRFVPTARPDVAWVELDGEAVVYDVPFDRMHRLNPSATLLWQCADGSGTIAEIVTDIADVYGEPPDAVLPGVVTAYQELGRQGLLVGVDHDLAEARRTEPACTDPADADTSVAPSSPTEPRLLVDPPSG